MPDGIENHRFGCKAIKTITIETVAFCKSQRRPMTVKPPAIYQTIEYSESKGAYRAMKQNTSRV